ncbi:MAG TPA: hypothetical protein VF559_04670 [Caulobacteraceae bacterium]|jgi:uncharacterized membrane protein
MSNAEPLPPSPPPDAAAQPAQSNLDPKTLSVAIYALYLASFLTAGATAIAGVIIAYVIRGEAPDWLKSHFEFQVRSFWIALVGWIVGAGTIWLLRLGLLVMLAAALWFLARAVFGLGLVLKNRPHPNPKTWMFAGG